MRPPQPVGPRRLARTHPPRTEGNPLMSDTTITIPSEVAAHVLFHCGGAGGYPAGLFTSRLLDAWPYADAVNAARLAAAFPAYGAAIALLQYPAGIEELRSRAIGTFTDD